MNGGRRALWLVVYSGMLHFFQFFAQPLLLNRAFQHNYHQFIEINVIPMLDSILHQLILNSAKFSLSNSKIFESNNFDKMKATVCALLFCCFSILLFRQTDFERKMLPSLFSAICGVYFRLNRLNIFTVKHYRHFQAHDHREY